MHFRQIARLSSLPLHLVAQLGRLLAEIFGLVGFSKNVSKGVVKVLGQVITE
jgi:hypothetical protein